MDVVSLLEAAERRANSAGVEQQRAAGAPDWRSAPDGVTVRRGAPTAQTFRSERVAVDGKDYLRLVGEASVYERGYEMWDWAGPYTETVAEGAGAKSLAANPDVVFLLNHTGIPFARTKSGTLTLSEPGGALLSDALLNPGRQDARDLFESVADGSTTEMSFAFRIKLGKWSPDFTEYRIEEYDIDRGDTSAVTFGANPHTSIEARAQRFALTNDLVRMAPALGESERELLADALRAAAPSTPADDPRPWRVGERAARDLRELRAWVADGSDIDAAARAALCGVIDDLTNGGGLLQGSDGPLSVVLGLSTVRAARAAAPAPMDLTFADQLLSASRRFNR